MKEKLLPKNCPEWMRLFLICLAFTYVHLAHAQISIRGKVTAEDGESIPGVNVFVKNTSIGTVTDMDGNHSLNVPNENNPLVFSFIRYISQVVAINGRTASALSSGCALDGLDAGAGWGYGTVPSTATRGSAGRAAGHVLRKAPAAAPTAAVAWRQRRVRVCRPYGRPRGRPSS